MDALGKTCGSEDCTKTLDIQAGNNAISCTKKQQAPEDVGSTSCESIGESAEKVIITIFTGLKELPGGVQVV